MDGDPAVGRVGTLTIGTRGHAGPGEVRIQIRGGSETFVAWSDNPLAKDSPVLVIQCRGSRTVDVIPWTTPSIDPGDVSV